jgi:competence protein ComFC
MRSRDTTILHSSLLSQNDIKYAGKTLKYRKDNPRDFKYSGKSGISVILIDDIVTTGTTLLEAKNTLARYGVEVDFALVLADV